MRAHAQAPPTLANYVFIGSGPCAAGKMTTTATSDLRGCQQKCTDSNTCAFFNYDADKQSCTEHVAKPATLLQSPCTRPFLAVHG